MNIPNLHVPTLHSERLELQALRMDHSDAMFYLWSNPQVAQHSGPVADEFGEPIPTPVTSAADSDKIIKFWIQAQRQGWGFRWAVLRQADERFLGTLGFNALGQYCEIAYHLHPQYWGEGYMHEACLCGMDWLGQFDWCQEFEAFIELDNKRSVQLALSLGFEQTQTEDEGAYRFWRNNDHNTAAPQPPA